MQVITYFVYLEHGLERYNFMPYGRALPSAEYDTDTVYELVATIGCVERKSECVWIVPGTLNYGDFIP